eukprot:11063624-Lingulodinium_polyedra.AAC.1
MVPKRRVRLRSALIWMERRPRVAARHVEIMIGHCADAALLRPCLTGCFRRVYEFVAKTGGGPTRLWADAAWEFS